jgi:hypothetical protein
MSDAQRFTELLGGCWHEWMDTTEVGLRCTCRMICGNLDEHIKKSNPTYSNPKDILNKMKEFCGIHKFRNFIYQLSDDCCEDTIMFVETYILNPPALLRKAIEFLETNNEKSI